VCSSALIVQSLSFEEAARRRVPQTRWGGSLIVVVMTHAAAVIDVRGQLIERLMPSSDGKHGNQFRDLRQVVKGSSTGSGRVWHAGTCPVSSGHGRPMGASRRSYTPVCSGGPPNRKHQRHPTSTCTNTSNGFTPPVADAFAAA
jgi:hypothetical protein